MQIPYPLLQAVILPIISAPFLVFLGRRISRHAGWLSCGVLMYTTVLLLLTGLDLWNGVSPAKEEYVWSTAVFNLRLGFLADGLSLPVAFVMNLVCTACAVYSVRYMEHRIEQLYGKASGMYGVYYAIFMLFPAGFIGVALSTNLIELYLFIELVLIPAYFMIDLFGYNDRHRIALMYFIWNHLGAALFLIGVVLAFAGNGGSFEVSALSNLSGSLAFWACFFILLGFLVKMAVFGFHVWIRYAHGNTPTSIAPLIAAIVGLGNYVIVRLLVEQISETFATFTLPLMIWAVITMIYGAYLTIAQDDIKLLFACSTISQTAYSLLGIASLTVLGVSGGIFYFLSHTLGKCILFLVAGIVLHQTGLRDMEEMGGLARRMPLTATLCILGAMILSAIPPLGGFQAEWILFTGIFQHGIQTSSVALTIALIGFFATFLALIYTFWPMMRIFFGPIPRSLEEVKEAPLSMTMPLLALTFISFLIGIFPDLITHFLAILRNFL